MSREFNKKEFVKDWTALLRRYDVIVKLDCSAVINNDVDLDIYDRKTDDYLMNLMSEEL